MPVFEFAVNGFPQRMLDLDIRFCPVDFFYRAHQKHNGAPEISLVGLRRFQ
ncbi:unknown [Dialister sp. CAG:357]|nr:unknown [Dialister sp. CAG:357]